MNKGYVAHASIAINAPTSQVWNALLNPEIVKQYLFGTSIESEWQVGSPVTWKGEWQGKAYEDKGNVLVFEPEKVLEMTHYSPLSGAPDVPESYHTVRYEVSADGDNTLVTLVQDNNATEEEKDHSEKNWQMMLEGLKKVLEK